MGLWDVALYSVIEGRTAVQSHAWVYARCLLRHMFLASVLYTLVLPAVGFAFSGRWTSFAASALHTRQAVAFLAPPPACAPGVPAARSTSASSRRTTPGNFRAHPNEYDAFFNKASRLGVAVIRNLSPEERARRALEASEEAVDDSPVPATSTAVPYSCRLVLIQLPFNRTT